MKFTSTLPLRFTGIYMTRYQAISNSYFNGKHKLAYNPDITVHKYKDFFRNKYNDDKNQVVFMAVSDDNQWIKVSFK